MPTSSPNSSKKKPPTDGALLRFATMGTQMLAVMLLFAFGGHKFDQWLNMKVPVLTIVLSILGVAVALYLAMKDLMRMK